jgi:Na+/citrate or Na+/malate symporter
MNYINDVFSQLFWDLTANTPFLAQTVTDPDVVGQMARLWNNFVKSGQIWAFLIGVGVAYVFLKLSKFG